jgi:hypothetical protein
MELTVERRPRETNSFTNTTTYAASRFIQVKVTAGYQKQPA